MNKLNLTNEAWLALGLHALYAGAGAALTYLVQNIGGSNFGTVTPVIVAVLSILSGYLHKAVTTGGTTPPAQ